MLFLCYRGHSLALKVVHIGQVTHDEPEGGALAYGALYAEAKAVLLEDGFGDGKPQTGALLARCLLYTSPSPRDPKTSRMPSSA